MYDERFVTPMRQELTQLGVEEMRTAQEVDTTLKAAPGTTLVVVNSVCGCAAGKASSAAVSLQEWSMPLTLPPSPVDDGCLPLPLVVLWIVLMRRRQGKCPLLSPTLLSPFVGGWLLPPLVVLSVVFSTPPMGCLCCRRR